MLAGYGVEYIFGVPGGQTNALYDAVGARSDLHHILMRDERSAAYAAVGYAKISNRIGVCDATVGAGSTKLTSGLAEAYNSSIPVIAIISDVASNWANLTDHGAASQGLNQKDMLRPISKGVIRIPSQRKVPGLIRTAFRKACTGRCGPVVVEIPHDVFDKEYKGGWLDLSTDESGGKFPSSRPCPDPDEIERAARLLLEAKDPVIIGGGGVLISQAQRELKEIAEFLAVPVATTFSGKGAIPEDHPSALGVLGHMGTKPAKEVAWKADLVFLIGFKSGQNSTFNWSFPRKDQKVIHLDIDPSEIGKVFPTAGSITADAKVGLEELLQRLKERGRGGSYSQRERFGRIEEVKRRLAEWKKLIDEEIDPEKEPIQPQRVVREINDLCAKDDILVCDASFPSGWGAVYFEAARQRRCLFPRGLAGLGFALPTAIGVSFAEKDKTIVVLSGDGGFTYSLSELATLRQHGIRIISIVLNNRCLAWIKWWQRLHYNQGYQSADLIDLDFDKIAQGFGLSGISVKDSGELQAGLKKAWGMSESVVVDVKTEVWETPILSYREKLQSLSSKQGGM